MGKTINLAASDGYRLHAYVAEPQQVAESAVVIVQEIFGVNSHIRSVTDSYARDGFLAMAPALFDRVQPNVELVYDAADMQRGMQMATQIGMENSLQDVAAAIEYARGATVPGSETRATQARKVGVVGFCYGGSLAWLAATRLDPAAAVGYYGGRIAQYASEQPRCPVMLHFGAKDPHIGPEQIEKIRRAHPELALFLYDAGHGFNCDQRGDYHAPSAAFARERTLVFLREHLR